MKQSRLLILSLLSAALLSVSWYWGLSFLIFFGFAPLLLLEQELVNANAQKYRLRLFGYSYLTFLVWNLLVTWWVVYASFGGACMAFICNSLLMALVFGLYSAIRTRLGTSWAVWTLLPVWLAWEYIHTLWDITWPWLTLGNVFAFKHQWIQWYEFTGTSGGSLWALFVNVLVFRALTGPRPARLLSLKVFGLALAIVLPVLASHLLRFYNISTDKYHHAHTAPTLVVQPNIDPYNEKFNVSYRDQFKRMLGQVRGQIDSSTEYLVLPETFVAGIYEDLNEEIINQYPEVQWFRDSLIERLPQLQIITGASTFQYYYKKDQVTATARQSKRNGYYYDYFNTALAITKYQTEIYHKSKLVPGVERMPFPALLRPLESLAINMGGTMGSLGTQPERAVFVNTLTSSAVAPVICYESVYADFVAGYIRKGANLIFIITNDGWWDDTPGYRQHLHYGRLRAIENRRQMARSANTGTSCFINEFGDLQQATGFWVPAVIKQTVHTIEKQTFFTRYGDLLSYISVAAAALLLLWSWLVAGRRRRLAAKNGLIKKS